MIPIQLQPIQTSSTSPLPNIGNFLGVSGNAPQVPPAFAGLPAGTLLRGFVLNREPGGAPVLRTDFGDFIIQSSAFLRIGAEVTIRLRAAGQQLQASIIEVDGKPVTEESTKNSAKTGQTHVESPTSNQRADAWQARQDTIQQSRQLPTVDNQGNVKGNFQYQAVLLNPTSDAINKLQLRQGSALILRLLNLQLPPTPITNSSTTAAQATAAQNSTAAGGTPAQTSQSSGNAPTAQPQQTSTQPAAAQDTAKASQNYQQHQLPGQQSATTNTTAAQNTTNNQPVLPQHTHTISVIGHEKNGDLVIQTPLGLAKITSKTSLPTGSIIQAQVSLDPNAPANPLASTQVSSTNTTPTSLIKLSQSWPALEQIMQFLNSPQAAASNSAGLAVPALPQVLVSQGAQVQAQPIQFSNGLFIFFAALGGGDFRNFLGDRNIQLLQQAGQTSLLNQAQADFAQLARLAGDAPSGQWQTTLFPVLVNGQVEMVRWFTKRDDREKKDRQADKESTRFIIEMNTSSLGELQLDGLYRQDTDTKKLDLVLRSHSALDDEIRQEIMRIVTEVNDVTGLKGSITFQSTAHFPEHPMEEVLQDIPDIIA